MRVISVNVGLPRELPWRGKIVRTAIWKRPVIGRAFAGRLNLQGDGQADLAAHGGEHRAVMVYQIESYRYWSNILGRSDFELGQFGENLTVEGLADGDVCIGDRYAIGSAVFEVSQPRVTCYRLAIRLDNEQMPALLVAHRRPGFYFRVIQEGEAGAGDTITKIADGPEGMTVADIDQLLYTAEHPVDALRKAVRISQLSRGWKRSMQSLLDAELSGHRSGNAGLSHVSAEQPAWPGTRRLVVASSQDESQDVRSFDLAADDRSALPNAVPGQHIVLKLRPTSDSVPVLRNYSLCGERTEGTYRIAVKMEEKGLASTYMHQRLKVGEVLESYAPRGSFILDAGPSPVVLLSAGVGLTPLLAMLLGLVQADKSAPREVWWVHSARDGLHHPFSGTVRDCISRLSNGRSTIFYTRPAAGDQPGSQYDVAGRVDIGLLKTMGMPLSATFYLCGPSGFMSAVTSGLKAHDVPLANIRTELFGPATVISGEANQSPHLPFGQPGAGPTINFVRSGLSVPWSAAYRSLLELAEACNVPVRWSCRAGVCHNCETGILSGKLEYRTVPIDPPPEGVALICCSTPLSNIDLDI
jgi:ferredoxin-NADP reductase/MOSC domain-containing protein YiiM/ferredoxin